MMLVAAPLFVASLAVAAVPAVPIVPMVQRVTPPVFILGGAHPAESQGQQDQAPRDEGPPDALSQDQPDDKKPPTPPHTGIRALLTGVVDDLKHLPTTTNMYVALGGGGLALAVHPADDSINAHLRSHYTLVNDLYAPAKYFGDTPEQVALSLGTYAYGRLFDQPKVSHLGMDLLRAQIVTEIMVEPLKFATHRQRPDHSNYQSFPSGHAAVTFAAATVLERHLGWKKSALAYVVAGYVATSRLHDNVHFASDVVFGAAVGTISGLTITQHGANSWALAPAPVPGGVAVLVTRVTPRER
jgi:hypothetical protein